MPTYHFDIGNSSVGPIGYCARIEADDKEEAVAKLRDMVRYASVPLMDMGNEYVRVYFNHESITVDMIDDEMTED